MSNLLLRDTTEANRPNPKGLSTATLGQVYVAQGSDTGTWATIGGDVSASLSGSSLSLSLITATLGGLDPNTTFFPEDYGAVGDGVTDDATAFNACLAAMTDGDIMVLSAKIYKLNSSIIVYNSTVIMGVPRPSRDSIYPSKLQFAQGIVGFHILDTAALKSIYCDVNFSAPAAKTISAATATAGVVVATVNNVTGLVVGMYISTTSLSTNARRNRITSIDSSALTVTYTLSGASGSLGSGTMTVVEDSDEASGVNAKRQIDIEDCIFEDFGGRGVCVDTTERNRVISAIPTVGVGGVVTVLIDSSTPNNQGLLNLQTHDVGRPEGYSMTNGPTAGFSESGYFITMVGTETITFTGSNITASTTCSAYAPSITGGTATSSTTAVINCVVEHATQDTARFVTGMYVTTTGLTISSVNYDITNALITAVGAASITVVWPHAVSGTIDSAGTVAVSKGLFRSVENCNHSKFFNVMCKRNALDGFFMDGPDSNACTIINLDTSNNFRHGLWDDSYLGNWYFGIHGNNNGAGYATTALTWSGTTITATISSSHTLQVGDRVFLEDATATASTNLTGAQIDGALVTAITSNTVSWEDTNFSGSGTFSDQVGTLYRGVGILKLSSADTNKSFLGGVYSETNQGVPHVSYPATFFPGPGGNSGDAGPAGADVTLRRAEFNNTNIGSATGKMHVYIGEANTFFSIIVDSDSASLRFQYYQTSTANNWFSWRINNLGSGVAFCIAGNNSLSPIDGATSVGAGNLWMPKGAYFGLNPVGKFETVTVAANPSGGVAATSTLWSYTMASGDRIIVKALIQMMAGSETAAYEITASARRNGSGAPAFVLGPTTLASGEEDATWDATFDFSSNDIRLRVTGDTANNTTCEASVTYFIT